MSKGPQHIVETINTLLTPYGESYTPGGASAGGGEMSGKTCSKCYYLLVTARRHKGCTSLSSNAEACKDFREVSVFDRITASPEVLAPRLVYAVHYGGLYFWHSVLIYPAFPFETKEEAIAATIDKLMYVHNE
jgi:hypothetical protein